MDLEFASFNSTTLIFIAAVLLVFFVQVLLCFKAESGFVKALPLLLFVVATIVFFVLMQTSSGWDILGYLTLGLYALIAVGACLIAWLIYGIVKLFTRDK